MFLLVATDLQFCDKSGFLHPQLSHHYSSVSFLFTVTFTLSVYFLSADVTVISAVPALTAVTMPVLLTVATSIFEDDQVTSIALGLFNVGFCGPSPSVRVISCSVMYRSLGTPQTARIQKGLPNSAI